MTQTDMENNQILDEIRRDITERCISCDLCIRECGFIEKFGKPGHIAQSYDPGNAASRDMVFECSLCSICTAVCPVGLDPAKMLLEMRKDAVQRSGPRPGYHTLTAYEKRGTSKRYTYYGLPAGCDTVFFPGCTLTGTRPKQTEQVFSQLRQQVPDIGIVLDCCTKPSHDLGRFDYFSRMFFEMAEYLSGNGVRNVIVACPNCHKVFKEYGNDFTVRTVYELLGRRRLIPTAKIPGVVTVHDPCPMRFEPAVHEAVRSLIENLGLGIVEMCHNRDKAICCGEGGAVAVVNEEISESWRKKRGAEAENRMMITYCAGCAGYLKPVGRVAHVLDLIFNPEKTLKGKARVSTAPWTYINRLLFKRKMKRIVKAAATRERTSANVTDQGSVEEINL